MIIMILVHGNDLTSELRPLSFLVLAIIRFNFSFGTGSVRDKEDVNNQHILAKIVA